MRVQRLAQTCHKIGQRVAEVPVFTLAKAVALHDHAAAKGALRRVPVQPGQRCAFGGVQQLGQHGIALLVQGLGGGLPVDGGRALVPRVVRWRAGC